MFRNDNGKRRVAQHLQARPLVGIILAAGASERMGSPKALLEFPDGTTLLARQASLLRDAGCARVAAVVGAEAPEIRARAGDIDVEWAVNARWRQGQFSSLQAGLAAALGGPCEGAVILPVDCAGVAPATVEAIIETALRNPHLQAVIPAFGDRGGHPIALSRELCREILARDPSDPASRLDRILQGVAEKILLPVSDARVVANINTPEEWEALRSP